MRQQTAQFCATCHKVHLDTPVNHYRWIRGFNEYDNWQASAASGEGARSFYYPPKPSTCADCHMPLSPSDNLGNDHGFVHSHRFPAANTALPTANEDPEQMQITQEFLKNKILSVDIFALSPAREIGSSGSARQEMSTSFAVGEEAESKATAADLGDLMPVTAPLNRAQPTVRRGDTVRVDVVVRTRRIGHFFPGGTVDAYDTWLELKATDDKSQTLFWSGMVEDGGKGPVEKGAHFYRSLMIDANGNPINKRNAWANRAVVYVHLIPPSAADTVHYRLKIPSNAGTQIKLHARLCYRKFAWWNTQFSFAGIPDPAQKDAVVSPDQDDRRFVFTFDCRSVGSGDTDALVTISIGFTDVAVSLLQRDLDLGLVDRARRVLFAQRINVTRIVGDVLNVDVDQAQADLAQFDLDAIGDVGHQLVAVGVDLLDRHGGDDHAHLAEDDVLGQFLDQ